MANSEQGRDRNAPDNMQDVGMPGVPGQDEFTLSVKSGVRRLRFRTLRSHNFHIQGGRTHERGCTFCSKGLAGVLETMESSRPPEPQVAESDGGDEEGTAPRPRSDGANRGERTVLWP